MKTENQKHGEGWALTGRAFGFCLLAGGFVYLLFGFWDQWDLPIHDGVYYYQLAHQWTPLREVNATWSPLYVAFYSLFHWVSSDPYLVYSVHRLVVLGLMSSFFWLVNLRFGNPLLATLLTLFLLSSETILTNFHVVHTAGLLYVVFVVWLTTRPQGASRTVLLTATLLGYFVRPEFIVAFLVTVGFTIFQLFKGRLSLSQFRFGRVALLFALLSAVFWWNSAPSAAKPDRSFEAFSQQRAWAAQSDPSVVAGWDHLSETRRIYGNADSLGEAVWNNPQEFARHLVRNLGDLPVNIWSALRPRSSLLVASLLSFACLLGVAVVLGGQVGKITGMPWFPAVAFASSGLAAALIIRPAALYLLPVIPLVLLASVRAVGWIRVRLSLSPWLRLVFGGVFVLGLCFPLFWARQAAEAQGKPILEFSRRIASELGTSDPVVLAFSAPSYCLWIEAQTSLDCSGLELSKMVTQTDMKQLIRDENVNVVVVDAPMRQVARDLAWIDLLQFENSPESFGFRQAREVEGGVIAQQLKSQGLSSVSKLHVRE